jgi:hypothetical protein
MKEAFVLNVFVGEDGHTKLQTHTPVNPEPEIQVSQPTTYGWVNPSPQQTEDWDFRAATQACGVSITTNTRLPETLDLSSQANGWWDVPSQDNDHSCVGWAVADLLRWHFTMAGCISKDTRLSARYIWLAAKETDTLIVRPTAFIETEGTTLKAALDVARRYGVVTENFFPSKGRLFQGTTAEFYARAANLKISSYFNLINGLDGEQKFKAWRQWLAHIGPILIRVKVDGTWHSSKGTGKPRFESRDYDATDVKGSHAALLVGYTKNGDFLVRNTWGSDWGKSGHVLVTKAYADKTFDEAYGVCVPSSERTRDSTDLPPPIIGVDR